MHTAASLSLEQMKRLRDELDRRLAAAEHPAPAEDEPADLQRRLYEAGLLSEIKGPVADLAPYRQRRAVPIQGEPLSETVIRERR
jgi:hypothetical protein